MQCHRVPLDLKGCPDPVFDLLFFSGFLVTLRDRGIDLIHKGFFIGLAAFPHDNQESVAAVSSQEIALRENPLQQARQLRDDLVALLVSELIVQLFQVADHDRERRHSIRKQSVLVLIDVGVAAVPVRDPRIGIGIKGVIQFLILPSEL